MEFFTSEWALEVEKVKEKEGKGCGLIVPTLKVFREQHSHGIFIGFL